MSMNSVKDGVTPLWPVIPGSIRNKTVVISDLHLGVNCNNSQTITNSGILVKFLNAIFITPDIGELVIAGDFLDEWYLSSNYADTDSQAFYKDVIAYNIDVFTAIQAIADTGDIKLVYIPGNHDMTLTEETLHEVLPSMQFFEDAYGPDRYRTGINNEIVIEHCHRYDPFSAPDTVDNSNLTNNDRIYPPGYFCTRIGATWENEGRPETNDMDLPQVDNPGEDSTQYGAYLNYLAWNNAMKQFPVNVAFDEKFLNIETGGFHDSYSVQDIYPVQNSDGTISSPTLYKNFQDSWEERQGINSPNVHIPFNEAMGADLSGPNYFTDQALTQYTDADPKVEVVVFGHTHYPCYNEFDNGMTYVNSGTWIDNNTASPINLTRTFAVITSSDATTTSDLYTYNEDYSITNVLHTLTIVSPLQNTSNLVCVAGTKVDIFAGHRMSWQFKNWSSSGGGTFGNPKEAQTTFVMPENDVTITANFRRII